MTYYEIEPIHNSIDAITQVDPDRVLLARMNEMVKCDKDHPLIGTYALSTCLCLILYDENNTYLMHILNDYEQILKKVINSLNENKKCLLIPGLYTEMTKIREVSIFLKRIDPNMEIEVLNLSEFMNAEYESIEFLYNTENKEFIKPDFSELLGKGR